jgi:hypothetical protein
LSPKLSDKKEKRDEVIRIRSYNYDRLKRLGDVSMDWDDVLNIVLDSYFEKISLDDGHTRFCHL